MKVLKSKKGLSVLAVVAVAVIGAVAGYAYFTASGSGSGTASVGVASSLTVNGNVPSSDPLYPGGPAVPVFFTVINPGHGNEQVQTISLDPTIIASTVSAGTTMPNHSCDSSAFSMPAVAANEDVTGGATTTLTETGNLTMSDNGTSQNSCEGNILGLRFTSN